MIVAILSVIFFIIAISLAFAFIFFIFLPAIEKQGFPFNYSLFSENEIFYNEITQSKSVKKIKHSRAFIFCSTKKECIRKNFSYKGEKSCFLFSSIFDSVYDCKYACVGFGDCVKACSRDAIKIENNCAVVNEFCNGCGDCINTCPKNLIHIIPNSTLTILCNAGQATDIQCSFYNKEINCEYKNLKNLEVWGKFCNTIKYLKFIK